MLLAKGGCGLSEPADFEGSELPEKFLGIEGVGVNGVIDKKENSPVVLLKACNFTDDVSDRSSAQGMAVEEMYIAEIAVVLASPSRLDKVCGKVAAFYQ